MFAIVYITASNMDEAKNIARVLVEEKLAACVNMFPITSVYNWNGIQEDNEIAMIVKTTSKNIKDLENRIKEIHSYEVPCLIYQSINGSKEFLDWIKSNTKT